MRHQSHIRKFGRNINQRKALFRSLIESFIIHEEIKTTEAKAKTIKPLIEKLITKAKLGSLHVRRQILAFLPHRKVANKLVDEIAPRFKKRASGYTKLVRLGNRKGDNSMVVKMELTEKKPEKVASASAKASADKKASKVDNKAKKK